jgi:hypothetical protein
MLNSCQLCTCAKCLPDPLEDWIKQEICSQSTVFDVPEAERFSPYVDFSTLSTNSLVLAAFRVCC